MAQQPITGRTCNFNSWCQQRQEGQTITSSWKSNALSWVIIGILFALLIPSIHAQVVVNSADWRDVYSGMQYGAITDQDAHFITDTQQATRILSRLDSEEEVLLITGNQQPMPGFRSLLVSRGFDIEDLRSTNAIDTNAELVRRAQPENLVIVGDAYGYNAISVGTYAHMQNAGVVFASSDTADLITDLSPQEVLVYGHIPTFTLELFDTQITDTINNQDRFEDNFELFERFLALHPSQAMILTNGEIIEQQLVSGTSPTLFIGRQTVPQSVLTMIRDSDVRTAVLIGNALAPNANLIKDETGISIFIKFAQGRDQQQFGLDLFNVPSPNPLVTLASAEYDPSQQSLLVTYQNPGTIATYFSATLVGQETVEDPQPVFIESGSYKTVRYSMSDPEDTISYTIVYGPSPRSLDLIVQGEVDVAQITIDDQSEVRVASAAYDTRTESFQIEIDNTGAVPAYVLVEAVDVRIGNERVRIGSEVTRIPAQTAGTIELPAILSERDLTRNTELSLELYYGQREFALIQFSRATLGFSVGSSSALSWTWIFIVAGVALLLGWLITKKKR